LEHYTELKEVSEMKNKITKLTLFMILTLFSSLIAAEISGKMIAYSCFTCHDEKSANINLPQILSEDELVSRLLDFKYDRKRVTIMNRISKGYTDSELEAVARYLSRLN
jgi:cytochrome c553